MTERIDKLERLMSLTATLLETSTPLTAAQLRRRVPGYPAADQSFRRQFERDKDDLREMGIPLVTEEAPGTDPPTAGYRIDRDRYYLRAPDLDADELAALHLAVSLVQLDNDQGIEGLWKLGGAVARAGAQLPAIMSLPTDPNLGPVFAALREHRTMTFTYNGVERQVDAYRLDFQRGHWYLSGLDHVRAEERNYRVDRIEGRAELGAAGSYARPANRVPGAWAQPWEFGDGRPVTATLLVDADQAPWAITSLGHKAVVDEREDGSVVFDVAVTNAEAFRAFVLSFLEHAEVLEPPELRQMMVEWLEKVP